MTAKAAQQRTTSGESPQVGPEPFTLVVFGASGDLTRRKLLPAIFQLRCRGLLSEKSSIVGYARSDNTDEGFRRQLRDSTRDFLACRDRLADEKSWSDFASRVFYHRGSYDNPSDFASLRQRIEALAAADNVAGNCVYYLATAPAVFLPIVEQLGRAGLARKGRSVPWARIVIEKPFGRDLQSARELNECVGQVFDEGQTFRIDHYLGKETVQNIMVLRFANSIFEHIWSHDYIDHVQITVAESLGVGARGEYYDGAGALRDIVQNHMMHLLSLVAMEPPVALTAEAIRNEKVKVLSALRPIPPQCVPSSVVRGQYTSSVVDGVEVPAYQQTANVAKDSHTETFVALRLYVDNWRWTEVPFYLRTGKCLPRRCTEISIHFKDVPQVLFNRPPIGPLAPNVLAIRVQPDEGISLEFQVKVPGPAMAIKPLNMDFGYADSFESAPPEAYERLLLDAANGDATLFTRSDEIEAAWKFVSPVIEGCSVGSVEGVFEYPAGTWGPTQADELIQADGKTWHFD
ncbi:MAG: glucose-6-phosphate dehydrogenase [Planctomycetes bacterium]|nr:glucose-6-phosphate dehydrogenase [Planctomycetota bacterium]